MNPPRGVADLGDTAKRLLFEIIEAQRDLPSARWLAIRREKGAIVTRDDRRAEVTAFWSDIGALADVGAIKFDLTGKDSGIFEILRVGYQHYEDVKAGTGLAQVEAEVVRFLDSEGFKQRHPAAHMRWFAASRALCNNDAEDGLTAIGLACREALQEFATELVRTYRPEGAPAEVNKDYARVKAVIEQQRDRLGERVSALLDALLNYMGAATDLVQRQVHGQDLTWEDARRAVFQTAIVMYEVDRALATHRPPSE